MLTDTTRAYHARSGLALPSDLTDGECAVLEPFLPLPSFVDRPRKWPKRRILDAMLFLISTSVKLSSIERALQLIQIQNYSGRS